MNLLSLLPFALGYLFSYLLRSAGAALAKPMALELGLAPAALGLLNASFYLAFALAQLPSGVLLDRWGPRRTLTLLFLMAALGCWLFALSEALSLLILGRALMGAGVALALVGAVRAYQVLWPARVGFLSGLTVALGGVGGLLALALALLLVLAPETSLRPHPVEEVGSVRGVLGSMAFLAFAYIGGFFALQSLWAGAYAYARGLEGARVGNLLLLNGASVLGALASGALASVWGSGRSLLLGVVLYALGLALWLGDGELAWAYAALGFGGGFNALVLTHTARLFPLAPGSAMTWVNLSGVVGIFLLQSGLGFGVELLGYPGALGFLLLSGVGLALALPALRKR
jgi:predicted MFS family arabinose efflux permease